MKTFYSDYVQHCMRFYTRHPNPKFKTNSDKQNWASCDVVFKTYSDKEQKIFMFIYGGGDTISDNVYQLSKNMKIKQETIWKLINDLERKIAKKRNLI